MAARAGAAGVPGVPLLQQAAAVGARYGVDAWPLRLRFAEAALLGLPPDAAPGAAPEVALPDAGGAAMPGGAAASNGERRGPVSNPWAASPSELQDSASGLGLKAELKLSDPRPALAAVQAMLLQRPAELLEALAGRVLPALAAGCRAGRAPDPTPGADPGPGAYPGQVRAAPGALAAALALAEESVRLGGASGVQVRCLSVLHAVILSYSGRCTICGH